MDSGFRRNDELIRDFFKDNLWWSDHIPVIIFSLLLQIISILIHHLVPCRNKVFDELLLIIILGIDFGIGPQY
jgi:uncharacterized membrane protein YadS